MIIYIHGFGGSGLGYKGSLIRKEFASYKVIAPTLSYLPSLAIDTLEQLIESYLPYETVYLIGSSLGGYYALYLANKYNIKAVLINPATNPMKLLKQMIGFAINYGDLSKFEWNEAHIKMLEPYQILTPKYHLYFLLAQKGDELIDWKEASDYLVNSKQLIVDGGDHSFVGIENHTKEILEFFEIKTI